MRGNASLRPALLALSTALLPLLLLVVAEAAEAAHLSNSSLVWSPVPTKRTLEPRAAMDDTCNRFRAACIGAVLEGKTIGHFPIIYDCRKNSRKPAGFFFSCLSGGKKYTPKALETLYGGTTTTMTTTTGTSTTTVATTTDLTSTTTTILSTLTDTETSTTTDLSTTTSTSTALTTSTVPETKVLSYTITDVTSTTIPITILTTETVTPTEPIYNMKPLLLTVTETETSTATETSTTTTSTTTVVPTTVPTTWTTTTTVHIPTTTTDATTTTTTGTTTSITTTGTLTTSYITVKATTTTRETILTTETATATTIVVVAPTGLLEASYPDNKPPRYLKSGVKTCSLESRQAGSFVVLVYDEATDLYALEFLAAGARKAVSLEMGANPPYGYLVQASIRPPGPANGMGPWLQNPYESFIFSINPLLISRTRIPLSGTWTQADNTRAPLQFKDSNGAVMGLIANSGQYPYTDVTLALVT